LEIFFFFHGLSQLPSHHFFDGLGLRFFKDAFFLQKIIDAGTQVFLAHFSNSFLRLRAKAKSSVGVALVFLMEERGCVNTTGRTQLWQGKVNVK
jgi:hypothetical protein